MIIKRIIVVLTMLSALILLCSCGSGTDNEPQGEALNQFLIEMSIELTCRMGSLAQSDEYLELMGTQQHSLVSDIGSYNYETPINAVIITVSNTAMDSIIEGIVGVNRLYDEVLEHLRGRMFQSIPLRFNGMQGVDWIIAASILTVNKPFLLTEGFVDDTYVLLIYENYNSVTTFKNEGNGIVSANSVFTALPDYDFYALANDVEIIMNEIFEVGYPSGLLNTIVDGIGVVIISGEDIQNNKTDGISEYQRQAEPYFSVFQDLFQIDTALNHEIKYIALDLSESLIEPQDALIALIEEFCTKNGFTLLLDTIDGLMEKGYIKEIGLGFEEGIIIIFNDSELSEMKLVTNATKWRSGLGAIGARYTVELNNDAWEITNIENQWIS